MIAASVAVLTRSTTEEEPLLATENPSDGAKANIASRKLAYEDDIDDPTLQFLGRLAKVLYGDLPERRTQRTILALAATLAVLLGGFWLLDSVKDSIFVGTVGLEYLPWAKPVSVMVSLLAVLAYTRMTELVPTPTLFGMVGTGFSCVFVVLAALLAVPGNGPSSPTPHSPGRLLGWICYCSIESFGSVAVALFWAFTNDRVDLETAKSSYGIIIAVAQLGAISGASIATYAQSLHSYGIFVLGAMPPVMAAFMLRKIAEEKRKDSSAVAVKTEHEGSALDAAWSGLRLVLLDPYVLGLLVVSSVSEVVLTILDFQLKAMGAHETGAAAGAEGGSDMMTSFMARFGQLANLVSLFMSLLGTSVVVRRLGVRGALLVFPMILTGVVGFATLFHGTKANLPFLVGGVAVLKGLTYALHEPLKEMLYKPTTAEVKFKARAWIDVFASRGAKAIGAAVNAMAGHDPRSAGASASLGFSLLVAVGMVRLAQLMGRAFDEGMKQLPREESQGELIVETEGEDLALVAKNGERFLETEDNEWSHYATADEEVSRKE